MRQPLTHISVSSVLDYMNCPLRWCYAWIDNRVPCRVPTALRVGTLVHAAFQDHFNTHEKIGQCLRKRLMEIDARWLDEHEQKAVNEAHRLCEPLDLWEDRFPISRTLEVEQPFEVLTPSGLMFIGRPDRVVVCNGQVYHFQHKTVGGSVDVGAYISTARHSMHELLYGWQLAKKYEHTAPYGGTLYNIVRKLKYRSQAKGKEGQILHTPDEMFFQTPIAIDPALQREAITDLAHVAMMMKETERQYLIGSIRPLPNRNRDRGPFGNTIDPYLGVIIGEASLADDNLFMDREDPYATEADEDE